LKEEKTRKKLILHIDFLHNGVEFQKNITQPDLTLWFVTSIRELEKKIYEVKNKAGKNGIWIIYPKKSSKVNSNLSQATIRNTGLAAGLVDYKVCSVNNIWSGIKFALKKTRK
jgi:small-conductance mechanosensitive channel